MRKAAWISLLLAMTCLAGCPKDSWRSTLYPEDWEPGFQDGEGRFLHDFSYAGYRYGEVPLPETPPGNTWNVVDYGADNTGSTDATAAVQAALNEAAGQGGIVFFPEGLYRCDGLLQVTHSGVVMRGDGPGLTRIFFTRAEGMTGKAHITFSGKLVQGDNHLLAADGANLSHDVFVDDAGDLAVGDDVNVGWVITEAFIAEHHMEGVWKAFNGQWKPFFRRTVTAIDREQKPVKISLDVPLRYPAKVRDSASVRRVNGYIEQCGIESLSVSNAVDWDAAWNEVRVHAIHLVAAKNCWIRNVTTFESPLSDPAGAHLQNGGIRILSSRLVTVADSRFENAQNRGGGGCGYLYEISTSNEVLIRDSTGIGGRHNFIQNWDFGTTGCVFLRCTSEKGRCVVSKDIAVPYPCFCEYHHSLAMACLVDQSTLTDGWFGGNRNDWSTGAGQTVTQSVYWNTRGPGLLLSWQFGWGYVVGTHKMTVLTLLLGPEARGTAPEDYVEGRDRGTTLEPQSLYEDQLERRLSAQ